MPLEPRRVVRRLVLGLALPLALGAGLTGCGEDEAAPPPPSEPLWNPCDGLDDPRVEELFDASFSMETGLPTAPLCSFTPQEDGATVVNVNYMLYPAGLEEAFATFGETTEDTTVLQPSVAGADGTRLVVDIEDDTLLVTGFVQNGDLIQTVNAVDPAPYARSRVQAGVRSLLGDLSAHATEAGVPTQ